MDQERRRTIHDAMVRLADGDRSAFPVLVQELWPVVLDFARRGVRHEQDAEDVAQEVFVRICSRLSDFDRERDGVSWAFGIAAYEVMTLRKRRERRREAPDEALAADRAAPTASLEDDVIRLELEGALAGALGQLSADDRLALGFGPADVAPQRSAATLRKRRQRALDRLRAAWRKLYGEP